MSRIFRVAACAAVALAASVSGAVAQTDVSAILGAAAQARRAQDFAGAEAAYARALQIRPDDAETLNQLALVQGYQGHYEQAFASIGRAVTLAPADMDILLTKARILAWMKRYGESQDAVARVLTARPGDADALALKGRVALYQDMPAAARAAFEQALARDARNLDALVGLGDAARAQGQESAARTYYQRAQAIDPGSADVRERLKDPAAAASPARWQFSASSAYSWLSRTTLRDWSEQSARLERTMDGSSFWVGAVHARRFGLNDAEVSVGASLRHGGIAATLEAGATPDDDFLPKWRVAGTLSGRVADSTFVLADASARRYVTGTVKGASIGVEQYVFGGKLDLSAKYINSFDPQNHHLSGWSASATLAPVDRLRLRAGYADAPEADAGVVAGTRSWNGGIAVDLTSALTLRVDYLHEDRARSYLRQELTAGLAWRF